MKRQWLSVKFVLSLLGSLVLLPALLSVPDAAAAPAAPRPAAPATVTAVVSGFSAVVRWTPPKGARGITAYTVSTLPKTQTLTLGARARVASVNGLVPGRGYRILVRAAAKTLVGAPAVATVTVVAPGGTVRFLAPRTVLDQSKRALPAGTTAPTPTTYAVVATGKGVPAAAIAVVLRLRGTAGAVGAVRAVPAAGTASRSLPLLATGPVPSTSTALVALTAGAFTLQVPPRGGVSVDIVGWVGAPSPSSTAGSLLPVPTVTLSDTPVAAKSTTTVQVIGIGQIPATAGAAWVQLTVSGATAPGSVAAGAASTRPSPVLAVVRGAVQHADVLVPLRGGKLVITSTVAAQVRAVAVGYVTDATALRSSGYLSLTVPTARPLDKPAASGVVRSFAVAGGAGVPPINGQVPPTAVLVRLSLTGGAVAPAQAGELASDLPAAVEAASRTTVSAELVIPLDEVGRAHLAVVRKPTRMSLEIVGYLSGAVIVDPNATRLSASALSHLSSVDAAGTLVFRGAAPAGVTPGRVLVGQSVPLAPAGLLLRVVKVVKAGSHTTVTTTPADLGDAFPALDVSFRSTISGPLPPGATPSSLRPGAARRQDASATLPTIGLSFDATPINDANATLHVAGAMQLQITVSGALSYDLGTWRPWASFTTAVTGRTSIDLGADAKVTQPVDVSLTQTLFDKDNNPFFAWLSRAKFEAGPIPLQLNGSLSARVKLKSSQLSLTTGYHREDSVTVGGTLKAKLFSSPSLDPMFDHTESHTAKLPVIDGSGEALAGLSLFLGVSPLGLSDVKAGINISLGLVGQVDTAQTPWWSLGGQLSASLTAQLKLNDHFNISKSTPSLDYSFPLLGAPGAWEKVTVTADKPTLRSGETTALTATVDGLAAPILTWSVPSGSLASVSPTATGATFVAPTTPGIYRVIATSAVQGDHISTNGYLDLLVVSDTDVWNRISPPAGPLLDIALSNDLKCGVQRRDNVYPSFYNSSGVNADSACATALAVDGRVFGPRSIPASGNPWSVFTPIQPTSLSGSGTAADPWHLRTVVSAGGTGVQVAEDMSYVSGDERVAINTTVTNTSGAARSTTLYLGGDCYVNDSDFSFGVLDADGSATCSTMADGTGARLSFTPLTPGSARMTSFYYDWWTAVGTGAPLPGTDLAGTNRDSAAGLSWSVTLAPGAAVTQSAYLTITG